MGTGRYPAAAILSATAFSTRPRRQERLDVRRGDSGRSSGLIYSDSIQTPDVPFSGLITKSPSSRIRCLIDQAAELIQVADGRAANLVNHGDVRRELRQGGIKPVNNHHAQGCSAVR